MSRKFSGCLNFRFQKTHHNYVSHFPHLILSFPYQLFFACYSWNCFSNPEFFSHLVSFPIFLYNLHIQTLRDDNGSSDVIFCAFVFVSKFLCFLLCTFFSTRFRTLTLYCVVCFSFEYLKAKSAIFPTAQVSSEA